jgi:hypothetical protein
MQLTFWMSIKYLCKQSHDFVLMTTDGVRRSQEERGREGKGREGKGRKEGRKDGSWEHSSIHLFLS